MHPGLINHDRLIEHNGNTESNQIRCGLLCLLYAKCFKIIDNSNFKFNMIKTGKIKFILVLFFGIVSQVAAQTPIPNNSFENWTNFGNYMNPDYWDTPNEELMAIPFFGTTVVTRSTDHHNGGSYSARLESKHITLPPIDVPGFITLGNLTLDIINGTYILTGGAPVNDQPTHLKGYYKFIPQGGDSCLIAIGLFKTIGMVKDTVAYGYFSTKNTVNDWTLFSAWIDYDTIITPDTMNVVAFSTAQEVLTPGTVLYLDDLFLDYTTGMDDKNPSSGINIYNDKETSRLIVFFEFDKPESTSLYLFNMLGRDIASLPSEPVACGKRVISYNHLPAGIYVLEINHAGKKFSRKFFLNP